MVVRPGSGGSRRTQEAKSRGAFGATTAVFSIVYGVLGLIVILTAGTFVLATSVVTALLLQFGLSLRHMHQGALRREQELEQWIAGSPLVRVAVEE